MAALEGSGSRAVSNNTGSRLLQSAQRPARPTGQRAADRAGDRAAGQAGPTLLATALVATLVGALVGWWVGGLTASRGRTQADKASVVLLVLLVLAVVAAVTVAVTTRRSSESVAARLERLAAVPLLAHLNAPADLSALVTLDPGSPLGAAFGPLRLAVDRQIGLPRPLLVTVAGPGPDGVPVWVGANLAIALARAGRRVLLVDARLDDLGAQPSEAPHEAEMPRGPGLVGVLTGVSIDDAASPGPVAGLSVLPPGTPDNQLEDPSGDPRAGGHLLGVDQARRLVAAASDFEVVVALDGSLCEADRHRSMPRTGALLLSVPERRVRSRELRDHIGQLRASGVRFLGTVLVADARSGE